MHRGRTIGWSGQLDWPPEPDAPRRRTVSGARPVDARSPVDVMTDTIPSQGLRRFHLGTVPASVTPPRTSRRAAWFAIVSSAAAMGGLVLASTALVERSGTEGLHLPGKPHRGEPVPDPYYLRDDIMGSHPRPHASQVPEQTLTTGPPPARTESLVRNRRGPERSARTVGTVTSSPRPPTSAPRIMPLSDTGANRVPATSSLSALVISAARIS